MTFKQALDYVHSLSKFGSKPGLERVSRLAALMGNPQDSLSFIHFAGTSGKGSTAAYTAAMLTAAGYKTGLYTSPFVVDFRERFRVNDKKISQEEFCCLLEKMQPALQKLSEQGIIITEFELITVLGFLWFSMQQCDFVCLEVGMGGRFDATNIIKPPLCAVLCSIGLDHTEYLGETIDKIAFEKCGIIKPGSRVVSFPFQKPEAIQVITARCLTCGCSPILPDTASLEELSADLFGSTFCYRGVQYRLRMPGRHQILNAVTALCTMDVLSDCGFSVPQEARSAGLYKVHCPARLELISRRPLIMIDGAHNADKVAALADTVASYSGRIVAVCGMLRDKDYIASAQKIGPLCRTCITVTPQNPRALSAEEMADALRPFCKSSTPAPDFDTAVELALSQMQNDDLLLCWGSLYIAGDLRRAFLRRLKQL